MFAQWSASILLQYASVFFGCYMTMQTNHTGPKYPHLQCTLNLKYPLFDYCETLWGFQLYDCQFSFKTRWQHDDCIGFEILLLQI